MRLLRFLAVAACFVALNAHAATDQFLSGSLGQAFALDIASTHAHTVSAMAALEDDLLPALTAYPGMVQAIGSSRLLHNMLQAPANLASTGQEQGITTMPYGVQGIDVWNATASVGYRGDWWTVFYSGGFVGTHSTQMGNAMPFESAGLMGLGFLEAVSAPVSAFRSTQFAKPYFGSAARYLLGGGVQYDSGSLRLAYAGGDPSGIMGALSYEPWNLGVSLIIDTAMGNVPFARIGMVRSPAPAKAIFGPDVGKSGNGQCDDPNCVIAPLTSLYARAYSLSAPQQGLVANSTSPQSAAFWTLHGEQLNMPLPFGYLDARVAMAAQPTLLLHNATVTWHTATFYGGAPPQRSGIPGVDVGLTVGYSQMPTLWYANNPGSQNFAWGIEIAWGNWMRGGVRRNMAQTLAMFPFASSSTEVFIALTQEAFVL